MEQDNTSIGLGIPYLILIFLTWLNAGSFRGYAPFYPWVYDSWGGLIALFGVLFLIPVFILTIIFMSTQHSTSESVAFGLAIPGWCLILTGSILGLYYTVSSYITPILFFIFVCPQIILGFGLYARRDYNTMPTQRPSPGRPRHRTYHTRTHAPRRVNPPPRPTRNQRGTIPIPDLALSCPMTT